MHCTQLLLSQLLLVQGLQVKFSVRLEMVYQQKVHLDMILAENSSSFLFHKMQFLALRCLKSDVFILLQGTELHS